MSFYSRKVFSAEQFTANCTPLTDFFWFEVDVSPGDVTNDRRIARFVSICICTTDSHN